MPNLRMSWLAGLAFLLGSPPPTTAQEVPSPYRFVERGQTANAFVGFYNPGRGRFGFGPGSGTLYGVRYSVELSGPIALETVGSYLSGTRHVVDPSRPEGSRIIGDASSDLLFIEARLRMSLTGRRTWHSITPYVFAGAGLGFGMFSLAELDTQLAADDRFDYGTGFSTTIGGGIRYFLGERWALRADSFLGLYKIAVPGGYRDPERGFDAVPRSEWVSGTGLSLGLCWLF